MATAAAGETLQLERSLGRIYCAGELALIVPPSTPNGRATCQRCGAELPNLVAHGATPKDRPLPPYGGQGVRFRNRRRRYKP